MSLDQSQQQYVGAWLKAKLRSASCSECGAAAGCDASNLVTVDTYPQPPGGSTIPAVAVTCANCGHMRLFAATVMNLPSPGKIPGP